MRSHSPQEFVNNLLPRLCTGPLAYFPIRHHSPACAAHLQRWITAHRPASVLVEGPSSFNALLDLLLDEQCVCPVAIYTSYVDKRGRAASKAGPTEPEIANPFGPPRFAAYYPFCDYSPELVALRTGKAVGARLRFIDLEYPEMVLAKQIPEDQEEGVRVHSLAADPHLRHSEYVKELARRLGCRDFNELWDHLFESCWDTLETTAFIRRVATYCAMARLDYTPEDLRRDGTTAREACMAAAIRAELARNQEEGRAGPVLVVTGGFHTAALPELVDNKVERPKPLALEADEVGTWLMRYSFDQLDALAGYASGMPSPAFYDRLWKGIPDQGTAATVPDGEIREQLVADLIVEIGRLTRERNFPSAISTPDAIAAVQMTRQLARLRGHPWPLREDVLDGVRSCFIKGELNVEGRMLMQLVQDVLAGNRVGQIPPGAGVPPIVHDFHREARRLRLPIDSVEKREMTLDLYRKVNHRDLSRLFHRLDLLETPFANFQGGPDFVHGTGLDLMQERWQVCWSPTTESALIEASIFGPTIKEAAAARLQQMIAQLEADGQGRNTAAAVAMLIRACRMGLHEQAAKLVGAIAIHIAEDPSFPSVVNGLSQLELLSQSREPLEAHHLTDLPRLMIAAYQRACRLAGDLATCPDEMIDPVMHGLRTLREVLAASRPSVDPQEENPSSLDPELFHHALQRVVQHPPWEAQAAVVGASAGILYGEGQMSEVELIRVTSGYLGSTATEARKSCGVLRGLLATAREIAWQVTEIVRALDAQFDSWDEKTFLEVLPELRLAFADLTPREVTRVADHVAGLHGQATLGELVHMDLDEGEVHLALAINQMVGEILQTDGLKQDN